MKTETVTNSHPSLASSRPRRDHMAKTRAGFCTLSTGVTGGRLLGAGYHRLPQPPRQPTGTSGAEGKSDSRNTAGLRDRRGSPVL